MKQEKQNYTQPVVAVVELELSNIMLGGSAPDSSDSEFIAPAQRRGAWGDLWAK